MSETFALDSWALLAYLQGEEPAASRVREVIEGAQAGTARLFISIINLGEVYYRVGKTKTPKKRKAYWWICASCLSKSFPQLMRLSLPRHG